MTAALPAGEAFQLGRGWRWPCRRTARASSTSGARRGPGSSSRGRSTNWRPPPFRTEGADAPFFSPDGEWVGFFAAGKLKKVPAAGGPPRPSATRPTGAAAAGPRTTRSCSRLATSRASRASRRTAGLPCLSRHPTPRAGSARTAGPRCCRAARPRCSPSVSWAGRRSTRGGSASCRSRPERARCSRSGGSIRATCRPGTCVRARRHAAGGALRPAAARGDGRFGARARGPADQRLGRRPLQRLRRGSIAYLRGGALEADRSLVVWAARAAWSPSRTSIATSCTRASVPDGRQSPSRHASARRTSGCSTSGAGGVRAADLRSRQPVRAGLDAGRPPHHVLVERARSQRRACAGRPPTGAARRKSCSTGRSSGLTRRGRPMRGTSPTTSATPQGRIGTCG